LAVADPQDKLVGKVRGEHMRVIHHKHLSAIAQVRSIELKNSTLIGVGSLRPVDRKKKRLFFRVMVTSNLLSKRYSLASCFAFVT
jgi:hypothetical protein